MSQSIISGNPFHDFKAVEYANLKTDSVLPKLSLKEKVGQMNSQGRFFQKVIAALLFGKGLPLMSIGENREKGIPGATFTDGPRGVVLKGYTNFPCAMARAAMWNTELEQHIGETMGNEAKHVGADLFGAPCMNLLRNPLNGRAQEAYGEDPYLTGSMASALVRGIQSRGVMATAKHYALNSIENSRFTVNVKIDKRTLEEVYLPHFKMVIDEGVASIMSAYNKVNGKYCAENEELLHDVLRKEWGFKGFVHSDWLLGVRSTFESIKAGLGVEMPNPKYYAYGKIKTLIDRQKLSEQEIDSLIRPTIFTKFLFEYFQKRDTIQNANYKANGPLALQAAEEATVLLKNENNVLPLDNSKIKTLALVGFLSDKQNDGDRGSSYSRSDYVITPLQAFSDYLAQKGITLLHADGSDTAKLRDVCSKADAVVVVAGIYYDDEGEMMTLKSAPKKEGTKSKYFLGLRLKGGGDREHLSLLPRDLKVIETATAANKHTIVMLIGGSAITMEEWKTKTPAIVMSWYHGMEGARAMPEVLFGDVNPSGKLPFTIPVNESDLPPKPFAPDSIVYGYYHGYTLFDKKNLPAAFPFGFGLSYTSFQISEPHLEKNELSENDSVQVTVKVKNTGARVGKEVVQLYIGFTEPKIDRPVKLLRAFKKVELKSGEEKIISLSVPVKSLAYFDIDSDNWKIEKTKYAALVGNSSNQNDLKRIEFLIK